MESNTELLDSNPVLDIESQSSESDLPAVNNPSPTLGHMTAALTTFVKFMSGLGPDTVASLVDGGRPTPSSYGQMLSLENITWFEGANMLGALGFTSFDLGADMLKAYQSGKLSADQFCETTCNALKAWLFEASKAFIVFNIFSTFTTVINIGASVGNSSQFALLFFRALNAIVCPLTLDFLDKNKLTNDPKGQEFILQLASLMLLLQYAPSWTTEMIAAWGIEDHAAKVALTFLGLTVPAAAGGAILGTLGKASGELVSKASQAVSDCWGSFWKPAPVPSKRDNAPADPTVNFQRF